MIVKRIVKFVIFATRLGPYRVMSMLIAGRPQLLFRFALGVVPGHRAGPRSPVSIRSGRGRYILFSRYRRYALRV